MTLRQRALHGVLSLFIRLLTPIAANADLLVQVLRWFRMRHVLFKPRPGDIYVATAPKTGTTWMMQIVYQIVTGGRGEFEHVYQVAPFLDPLTPKSFGPEVLEALPSPRIFKTHLYYWLVAPPADSRVIYVTRNAADSLVSLHHHIGIMEGYWGPLGVPFLRGSGLMRQWFKHLESWWPHRQDPNVLHLRYEDMAVDLEGTVRKVARFLGVTLEEDRLGDIVEKCSFAYMKKHNERFDIRLRVFQQGASRSGFIRKGQVGDGRAVLAPDVQAELDGRMGRLRKKLGIRETEV